jgi:hypothetical protein
VNINAKGALKASTTVATAATKTLTHMVQKEAVDVAATVASPTSVISLGGFANSSLHLELYNGLFRLENR